MMLIGQHKITLVLQRWPEHANVNGIPVPQRIASASCVIEGGWAFNRNERSAQVRQRLIIMKNKITDWVEFSIEIREQVHMNIQLEEIEISNDWMTTKHCVDIEKWNPQHFDDHSAHWRDLAQRRTSVLEQIVGDAAHLDGTGQWRDGGDGNQ